MSLKPSQISTLGYINEKPGKASVSTVGLEMARELEAAGYITIKGDRCYPTAAAAPYKGRPVAQQRSDREHARATLIGRWGTAHFA